MEQKGEVMHPSMESGVRLFLVGIVMWVAGFAVGEIPGAVTIWKFAGVQYSLSSRYIAVALGLLAEVPIVVGIWKYYKRR